jgi:HK97 family phage prohead protease
MIVYKQLQTDVRGSGDRRMTFTISTGTVDRDGDVLSPKGWVLDTYRRNPIVTWAHDYKSLPIAKCVQISATRTGLEAVAEFPPKGTYEFADTVFDMLQGGFLSATSVGFRPIEFEDDYLRKGKNYLKQELTEFSVVPIPSNPDALIQRSPQGRLWTKALRDWAVERHHRDSHHDEHPSPKGDPMTQTRDNEVVLTITDELHARYNAHQIAGWKKIDRYNELYAQEEAARQAKHDAWLIAKGFKEERS